MAISGNLGAKQERAVLALLSERTIEDAATAAQVGLRTLHRWLKTDAVFIAAYRAARVTAATKILEIAIRGCEIEELKQRLDALERHQEVPDAPAEEASIVSTH